MTEEARHDDIWVGMIASDARKSSWPAVIRKFEALTGLEVHTESNRKNEPEVARSVTKIATRIVLRAAAYKCSHVLILEDDIDFSPRLATELPRLKNIPGIVTLYLPELYFYPKVIRDQIEQGREIRPQVIEVPNREDYWGGQALLMPTLLAMMEIDTRNGEYHEFAYDLHIRSFCLRYGLPIYAPVPNLVQHLSPPSVEPYASGYHVSRTFR